MPRKKTHDEFLQQVKDLTGDEYTVLSRYLQSATKIKMRHNKEGCGHEWDIRPADFLRGTRCNKCWGNNRMGKLYINEPISEG